MKKTWTLLLIMAILTPLTMVASINSASAIGIGIGVAGGCTTILPVFPSSGGAAVPCAGPYASTTKPLRTDGSTQFVGAGVDDSPAANPYSFTAVNRPMPGTPGTPAGVSATIDSYSEPCLANEPPPFGFANGELTITIPAWATDHLGFPGDSAQLIADYSWVRMGLVAIILTGPAAGGTGKLDFAIGPDDNSVDGGVISAVMIPIPPLPTCLTPAPLELHVVAPAGFAALIT